MDRQPAKFGAIEFDVTAVRDVVRRDLEINRYPNRNGADIRDRGAQARRTTCDIVFFPRTQIKGEQEQSNLPHDERFRLFFIESQKGRALEFVHPEGGGYRARIESVDWSIDYGGFDDLIECTATFVEDSTNPSALVSGSARPRSAGIAAAKVTIDDARFEVEALNVGASTGFLDSVESEIAEWQATPDVLLDITARLGRMTRLIETSRNNLALTSDVDNFQAFIALERVANSIREAAEAVRQKQPQFRETVTLIDQPLRRFVLAAYDADAAADRFDQILAVNLIRDPGFIPAGTVLLIPVDDVSPKISLRSAHR